MLAITLLSSCGDDGTAHDTSHARMGSAALLRAAVLLCFPVFALARTPAPPIAMPTPAINSAADRNTSNRSTVAPGATAGNTAASSATGSSPAASGAPPSEASGKSAPPRSVASTSRALPPLIAEPDNIELSIDIVAGETRVLATPNIGRVVVGSGRLLSASVLDDREILLIANEPGVTTLHLWGKDGRTRRMRVTVRAADMGRVTREILEFLGEQRNVRARAVGDRVLVEGQNLTDEQLFKIEELAKRYPQIVNFTARLGWEKMILLDVRVIEFKIDKLRELGVRWATDAVGPSAGVAGDVITNSVFTVRPPSQPGGISGAENLPANISPFQWYFGIVSAVSSRLNIYERNGDAVVLAAPQLTARSGSTAKFQSGGEIPYSVVGNNGQVNVQFKNYGIILEVRSRVDSTGAVRSEILAEVSEPDNTLSPASNVPGLRTRRTQTEFNVRAGQTMVLSGLLDRRKGYTVEQVPGLGNIPILGHLFKSRRFIDNETELVIFVTPTVVDAETEQLRTLHEQAQRRANERLSAPAFSSPTPGAESSAGTTSEPEESR